MSKSFLVFYPRDILIAAVDFSIHKVFVDLEHRGMMDNTIVVVRTAPAPAPSPVSAPVPAPSGDH